MIRLPSLPKGTLCFPRREFPYTSGRIALKDFPGAITGIASFAIPDFSFGFHLRLMRFLFIVLGYIAGFFGIGLTHISSFVSSQGYQYI